MHPTPDVVTLPAIQHDPVQQETITGIGEIEIGDPRPGETVRQVHHANGRPLQIIPALRHACLNALVAVRKISGVHARDYSSTGPVSAPQQHRREGHSVSEDGIPSWPYDRAH